LWVVLALRPQTVALAVVVALVLSAKLVVVQTLVPSVAMAVLVFLHLLQVLL
jgi:hypothetical protein